MANAIYPAYKQALLDADANVDIKDGDVRVILVDTDQYTYNAAHQFLSSVPALARIAVSGSLQNNSVAGGVFDADDVTLNEVTGAQAEALIIYVHTGSEATSRLVAYIDTGVTGLPVTPNGGNIIITWNASGIFAL